MTLKDLEQHELCTREEISEILRISTRTVNRMMADGQLKYIKLGAGVQDTVRIPKSEIERLLNEATERQAEHAKAHTGSRKRKVKAAPIQTEQSSDTGEQDNAE